MRRSVIKSKLARGEPVLVTHLHLADPTVYEIVSLIGFDGIWIDLEHSPKSVETAAQLIRAARVGGADVMARCGNGEFARLQRLLEAGAKGIMYPRCASAAEASEAVRHAKFAPVGTRGVDGGNADNPYGTVDLASYTQRANGETFLAVQLEDQSAIDQADEIAAVDGVDVLFFGPADFSVLGGFPDERDHPSLRAAVVAIAKAARSAGKAWGMPASSVENARELLDLGARFIAYGVDIVWLRAALEETQRVFGALGFTFDNRLSDDRSLVR